MSYVITGGCCNDAACVSVCPVDCIRPKPGDAQFMSAEQLYIDPVACIDCGACLWECPVGAISDEHDLPSVLDIFKQVNADYFDEHPLEERDPAPVARRRLTQTQPRLRVAVIGAGASGCYAVDELSGVRGIELSVFDRLPTPYGLVRSGVAPDHQHTKAVTKQFHTALTKPNVTCYFNVDVGRHLTVDDLLQTHHAVIFAAGADDDRKLGIAGEALPGSYSAREFVAWYNGHPDNSAARFDLSGERVVIVGNGNVALDVARVLASPAGTFDGTDMAEHAIEVLRTSGVREVVVSARRGALDAAYTTGEFLSLLQSEGIDVVTSADEVLLTTGGGAPGRFGSGRRQEMALAAAADSTTEGNRRVVFRYMLTPLSINGTDAVESVTFARTGGADGETETLETSLVLRAIGYRSSRVSGLPFDEDSGRIVNTGGRVTDPESREPLAGLYVSGWAKRGATGIIGNNRADSAETASALFEDYLAGTLADPALLDTDVTEFVTSRQPETVDFAHWLKIDAEETSRGSAAPVVRPRTKLFDVEEMLRFARR